MSHTETCFPSELTFHDPEKPCPMRILSVPRVPSLHSLHRVSLQNTTFLPCSEGYSCPVSSSNTTASICAAGEFSAPAAAVCSPCTAGYRCPNNGTAATR